MVVVSACVMAAAILESDFAAIVLECLHHNIPFGHVVFRHFRLRPRDHRTISVSVIQLNTMALAMNSLLLRYLVLLDRRVVIVDKVFLRLVDRKIVQVVALNNILVRFDRH